MNDLILCQLDIDSSVLNRMTVESREQQNACRLLFCTKLFIIYSSHV